jgi:hypothetical protein
VFKSNPLKDEKRKDLVVENEDYLLSLKERRIWILRPSLLEKKKKTAKKNHNLSMHIAKNQPN